MNRVLTEFEVVVIQMMRACSPRSEKELRDIGLTLQALEPGAYRWGYRIVDTELIVKVPREEMGVSGERHSKKEVEIWNKLLRSPAARTVPPLRYYNEYGIVVTDKVHLQTNSDQETRNKINEWKRNIEFPFNIVHTDMHDSNVGVYNNRYVVCDLGNFYEDEWKAVPKS